VWVFGWHEHTNNLFADDHAYGDTHNLRDEVEEFVAWLNENFIQKRTTAGRLIAQYGTVEEVVNAFRAWEAAHPGETSFNYPVRVREWDLYPYQLKGLTEELMYAHYDVEIVAFHDQGVHAHRFLKTDGRNWRYEGGRIVSSGLTWPIYLLWSNHGEKTIDFSDVLSGSVKCRAGRTGTESLQSASSVHVMEEPIACTATR